MALATALAMASLGAAAALNTPQESSTLSFTLTTTSSYFVSTSGQVTVNFNSVQLDTSSPQAYAFGVTATASPGSTIARLHWDFGDGIFLDVPYCCQSHLSEVRYHAYQQPGTYTVTVIAYDTGGNSGQASVTISWPTPIPEFPTTLGPIITSLITGLATVGFLATRRFRMKQ
jgi:hypothetical protein